MGEMRLRRLRGGEEVRKGEIGERQMEMEMEMGDAWRRTKLGPRTQGMTYAVQYSSSSPQYARIHSFIHSVASVGSHVGFNHQHQH